MARKAPTTKNEQPSIKAVDDDIQQGTAAKKHRPLITAAKTALNDPLVHSLVSGLVISAARKQGAKNGIGNSVIAFAATRIARKSLPGALLLGAGLLAKNWYDLRKARAAKIGQAQTDDKPARPLLEHDGALADTLSVKHGAANHKKSAPKSPHQS